MTPSRRREAVQIAAQLAFTRQTVLTNYYPLPREILNLDLPATAILLYVILLDRATLSQKSGWTDAADHVYVIYPIEKLAQTLHVSETAVKRHLAELEKCRLIERQRPVGNGPSNIFLNLPADSERLIREQRDAPSNVAKAPRPTVRKGTAINQRKPKRISEIYYQHKEDESL